MLLNTFVSLRNFLRSVIVLELECLAIMSSLMVVILDLPAHVWQVVHDLLAPCLSSWATTASARIILPYGCVYTAKSTREFWSRWSRPATQLIRHLLYYPLGGRKRWYLSIPIMFGLNATSYYDLSRNLVGDPAEIWWNTVFGTLAIVAMLEVAGDCYFVPKPQQEQATNDTTTSATGNEDDADVAGLPKWYVCARILLVHVSLRVVLYVMIHKCLKTSLGQLWGDA